MMPYAKAVSAKCHDFDDNTGLETKIDFARMMKIVTDAGASRAQMAQALYRLGTCYLKKGREQEAVAAFEKLIA